MQDLKQKIALGTVQFGLNYGISNQLGVTPENEVQKILDYCKVAGIKTLDTAHSYGNCERILGSFELEDFNIVSKFPGGTIVSVQPYVNQSLERLNRSSLYGYLAHDVNSVLENPQLWDEISKLREDGIIHKIGYSLYSPSELEKLLEIEMVPDLIQIPFNILDQRFAQYFHMLESKNVEIHTRSCFLQGLFFVEPRLLDGFFKGILGILKAFHDSFSSNEEKASYLLNFCVQNDYINKVVIGVNNLSQLAQNLEHLGEIGKFDFTFTEDISEAILLPSNWRTKK